MGILLDQIAGLFGQGIGVLLGLGFGVYPHDIFRPTGTDKGSCHWVHLHTLLEGGLEAVGMDALGFRRIGPKDGPIGYGNLELSTGQVGIEPIPCLESSMLQLQNGMNQQEIRERISDGLIDEPGEGAQPTEGHQLFLGKLTVIGIPQLPIKAVTKQNGPVSIAFKVDANIELQGRVMDVLDARLGQSNRDVQPFA